MKKPLAVSFRAPFDVVLRIHNNAMPIAINKILATNRQSRMDRKSKLASYALDQSTSSFSEAENSRAIGIEIFEFAVAMD